MIIEDEQDVLLTYELHLREEGYNVYGFSDPRVALEVFRTSIAHTIDIVISDIRMMSMNGIQLYRELKSISPELQIIFISALDAAPEVIAALPGFKKTDYFTKPVDKTILAKVVSAAIDKSRRSQPVKRRP
jgi:DNA-binding NtrC family response regulator